jgi:hypothetical protein
MGIFYGGYVLDSWGIRQKTRKGGKDVARDYEIACYLVAGIIAIEHPEFSALNKGYLAAYCPLFDPEFPLGKGLRFEHVVNALFLVCS